MTTKKDKVLQKIFDNDPMGILDGNFKTKKLPDNWWDYGINPIVGFKVPKVGDKKVHKRNVHEYLPEDDEKWWKENE